MDIEHKFKEMIEAQTKQILEDVMIYGQAIVCYTKDAVTVLNQKQVNELCKWRKKNFYRPKKSFFKSIFFWLIKPFHFEPEDL